MIHTLCDCVPREFDKYLFIIGTFDQHYVFLYFNTFNIIFLILN